MPSKNTKTVRRTAHKGTQAPAPKDDGTRWAVVRHGEAVYGPGQGTTRVEAERLAAGLLMPTEIVRVDRP
jgi:hypothetical protein